MMRSRSLTNLCFGVVAALFVTIFASPSVAAWRLILATEEVKVGKADLAVTPPQNWNRWTSRPSNVGEVWTLDGVRLNELSFFAGVEKGDTLYYDQGMSDKPLPTFDPAMLQTEIVSFFESSNRLVLESSQFEIKKVEPAKLAGHDGVRFSYRYAAQGDGVMRSGEAVAAKIKEKLYLINFVAPEVYFFDRDIVSVRQLIASAKIVEEPKEE
jgi:hypothetical protein